MSFSFFSALTLLFVWAKLSGHIAWSWFLVFSPMIVVITFACVGIVIATYLKLKKGEG